MILNRYGYTKEQMEEMKQRVLNMRKELAEQVACEWKLHTSGGVQDVIIWKGENDE